MLEELFDLCGPALQGAQSRCGGLEQCVAVARRAAIRPEGCWLVDVRPTTAKRRRRLHSHDLALLSRRIRLGVSTVRARQNARP